MNYVTDWRSRDLLKAWNENNIAQIELMKLFAKKVSKMIDVPVKLGDYIDRSSSLHLYGLYIDRDGLEQKVEQMKNHGWESKSMGLNDYFEQVEGKTEKEMKKFVYAQSIAEYMGVGLNQPESKLHNIGIDINKFPYPKEWDSWPKSWDIEPYEGVLPGITLR